MDPSTTRSGTNMASSSPPPTSKAPKKRNRKPRTAKVNPIPAPPKSHVSTPAPPIEVSIHGACKNNGNTDARASYGISFPQAEIFNESGLLPGEERQASNAAVLFAARRALEIVGAMGKVKEEGGVSLGSSGEGRKVVVKTHSSYVKLCMKKWINIWAENGWRDVRGEEVVNRGLIESLSDLVRDEGLEVEWVRCQRELNGEATALANKAFPPALSKRAKKIVKAKERAGNVDKVESAIEFFIEEAHRNAGVAVLAKKLDLALPCGITRNFVGFMPAIRRLVITGEDTPENFQLLFGEYWESVVYPEWKHTRMDHLSNLERGDLFYSPVGAMMDKTAPFKNLRPASQAELKRIPLKKRVGGKEPAAEGEEDWELLSDDGEETRARLGRLAL